MKYEKICRYAFILILACAIVGLLVPFLIDKQQFFPWSFFVPLFIAFILGACLTFIMEGCVETLPGFWIETVKGKLNR